VLTIPATKLTQFGLNFYQAAVSAYDIQKLVRFEVLSYESTRRRERTRRSGGVNWKLLEQRLNRGAEAYQRPIIRKKIRELVGYYQQCEQSAALPAIPGAVILVAERALEFRPAGKNPLLGMLLVPEEEGILRALDGQHRLLALSQRAAEADLKDFSLPAVIFDGLKPDQSVEMFVTINAKHTRLNPSHLITLQGRRLYPDRVLATCHDIIRALHEQESSALKGEIKLLGVGRGRVSQAALADELSRSLERLEEVLGPRAGARFLDQARRFFVQYFNQVAATFPTAWAGRSYSIRTAAALRAFIKAAPDVLAKLRSAKAELTEAAAIRQAIARWGGAIGDARFQTDGAWRAKLGGGTRGTVELLAAELRSALEAKEP
jgi:DGQHR domain-containing protein